MNQLPDRCPAVDDTTARRCMLNENHDGPHMDWTESAFSVDEAPSPIDARIQSLTEAVLARLELEGVNRYDRLAARACLMTTTVAPAACVAIYEQWFFHQNVTR